MKFIRDVRDLPDWDENPFPRIITFDRWKYTRSLLIAAIVQSLVRAPFQRDGAAAVIDMIITGIVVLVPVGMLADWYRIVCSRRAR